MADWLDEITNNNDSSYDYDFSGYNYGDTNYGTQEYQPEGYQNPSWDSSEHYSYEPGYYYPEESGEEVLSGGAGAPDSNGSNFGNATPWGESSNKSTANTGGTKTGGSSGNNQSSWSRSSMTSYATPSMPAPTMGEIPGYVAPVYDTNRVKALRQSKAASGISKLRSAVSEAIARSVSMDNPYLRKLLMRGTLRGFGEGLGSVMGSAETQAESAYAQEYTPKVQGSLAEYQANVNRINTIYQGALQEYLNTMTRTTTTIRS